MVAVAAVVVTYNRADLLRANLAALVQQTHPPTEIIVIDNASSDATAAVLAEQGSRIPALRVVRLAKNIGGAGGFSRGLLEALRGAAAWVWLMDDDCIPRPDALAQLLAHCDRFPADLAPDLAVSRAVWQDGLLHPLNVPGAKDRQDRRFLNAAADRECLSIRWCTFVSVLISRQIAAAHAPPMASYFLWSDDIEYTARLLRAGRGALVPASVVEHRTPAPQPTIHAPWRRFRLHVRNHCWMLLYSRAFAPRERIAYAIGMLGQIRRHLAWHWRSPVTATIGVITGMARGLLPPPAAPADASPDADAPPVAVS